MNEKPLDAAARLDTLEERFAQQEKVVADLNEVVTAQWSVIDALQRQMEQLREDFQNLDLPPARREPPPPHY